MYFCVLKCKMTLTVAYHVPFFHQINFSHRINTHSSYCIQIQNDLILSQFLIQYTTVQKVFSFICEGYTKLEPLVEIFCTNMAVEKKSKTLWINTSSCARFVVNTLSFFKLNFILYCVVHWTCQVIAVWTLQTVFVISVASLWLKNINKTLRASLEKFTMPISVCSWEIKISHGLHTRYDMFMYSSVSQTFFKWGPLLLVRMFYGPPYSCLLWKQIVGDSQLWCVIRNSR
jgi:hypothetical protein